MKNNNSTTFIIICGAVVLLVFIVVMTVNLIPKITSSDSYFVKVEDGMDAKIESLNISGGKVEIITSGNAIEYCIKSTKTTPSSNSVCWNEIKENKALISVFEYKEYYVWIKDENGNISNPMSINTRGNN